MMSSAGKKLARSNVLFYYLIGSLYHVENNSYQKALRFLQVLEQAGREFPAFQIPKGCVVPDISLLLFLSILYTFSNPFQLQKPLDSSLKACSLSLMFQLSSTEQSKIGGEYEALAYLYASNSPFWCILAKFKTAICLYRWQLVELVPAISTHSLIVFFLMQQ